MSDDKISKAEGVLPPEISAPEGPKPEAPGPRERVLDAALTLFVEQGYFNTNVPDISRHSRCSVGSIYHHFLNKEEIAADLYKQGIEQFRHALSKGISTPANTEQSLREMVASFLAFAEDNEQLSRYLWLARHDEFLGGQVNKPTFVGFDTLGRKLTKVIKNGIRGGEIPNLKAEVYWSILFGIPLSYVRDWLEGYSSARPSEMSSVLANSCWAALTANRGVG